jgi:hypothetical protein
VCPDGLRSHYRLQMILQLLWQGFKKSTFCEIDRLSPLVSKISMPRSLMSVFSKDPVTYKLSPSEQCFSGFLFA